MAKSWIKGAINPAHKGQFAAKAEKAGKTTEAFAREHEHAPGKLGEQARLALTLMGMSHSKKEKSAKKPSMASRLYGEH